MQSTPDLSIVVPAYAEAPLIVSSLRALAAHLRTQDEDVEVLVVVAESDDGTLEMARHCAPWFDQFHVIDAGPRAGKGRDVRIGMLAARGHYRLFMDADLATPLRHLDRLRAHRNDKAEIVIGVRDLARAHGERGRRWIATGGNMLVRLSLLPGLRDTQCGFKMFRSDVCEEVFGDARINGWGFDLEVLAAARRRGYAIRALCIDDWHDPKPASRGLGTDTSGSAAAEVLGDLLRLRLRYWMHPRRIAPAKTGVIARQRTSDEHLEHPLARPAEM